MNWYLTKLIFNINVNNGGNDVQFDEQLRLIKASDAEEAFYKARVLGKEEEKNQPEEKGLNQVKWKFIDVAELNCISELKDGMEIYSTTHEQEEASDYIKFIRHRAMVIQSNHLSFA